jgi:hypothetical protein
MSQGKRARTYVLPLRLADRRPIARSGSRLHLGAAFFDLGRPFQREQVFQANAGIPSGGVLLIEDLAVTPPFVTENRSPLAPPAFAKTKSDPITRPVVHAPPVVAGARQGW